MGVASLSSSRACRSRAWPNPPPAASQARNQQLVRVVRALVRQLQKAGGALGLPEDAASALKSGTPVAAAAALRRMQVRLVGRLHLAPQPSTRPLPLPCSPSSRSCA